MIILPIFGLLIGVVIGIVIPFEFPQYYSTYVAMGILACIDSVLGGIKSSLNKNFHIDVFMSGFFGNAILAMVLIWLGNKLNIQLSIAVVVVYGSRLFNNFSIIRRFILNKFKKKDTIER